MSFAETPFARHRFSADEVLRMAERGGFEGSSHVELLEGDLIVVSPQSAIHAALTVILRRTLEQAYGAAYHLRDHSPVCGTVDSIPEPDIAVTRGDPRAFLNALPGPQDIPLVVEVAFSSLAIDREKARIYARAGYAAYWLIDIQGRRVQAHTNPTPDGLYAKAEIFGEEVEILLPASEKTLKVRHLLP